MINWENEDMKGLMRIYAVANTPYFLEKSLKSHATVRAFGTFKPLDELVFELRRIMGLEKLGLADVVCAYAVIVALTFKEVSEVCNLISDIDFGRLRWGNIIFNRFRDTKISANQFVFSPDYRKELGSAKSRLTSTTSSTFSEISNDT